MRFTLRAWMLFVGYCAVLLRIGELLTTFYFPRLFGGH